MAAPKFTELAPDGSPKTIWSSHEDLVYALAFDQAGRLLAGTGNRGKIFVISGNQYIDLAKASANQVTAFARAPKGGLYAATSNLGKIFLLGPNPVAEGTYESDVFDAKNFSQWGRVEVRGSGDFDVFARSGNVDNPDRNWSLWKQVDLQKDLPVDAPSARFIQWKAVLHPGKAAAAIAERNPQLPAQECRSRGGGRYGRCRLAGPGRHAHRAGEFRGRTLMRLPFPWSATNIPSR